MLRDKNADVMDEDEYTRRMTADETVMFNAFVKEARCYRTETLVDEIMDLVPLDKLLKMLKCWDIADSGQPANLSQQWVYWTFKAEVAQRMLLEIDSAVDANAESRALNGHGE